MNHIILYPCDMKGCGSYRMKWPGEAALRAGHMVNVLPYPKMLIDNNGNLRGMNLGTANVVIFQRPTSYQIPQAIPILQKKGVSVIVDMDDDLSCIHPRNPSYKPLDPRTSKNKNWMHAAKSCEIADWVTVTTPALAEKYGSHGRCSIIPNHIPERYLKIKRPENPVVTVGWAGWTQTHVDDLRVTSGMVAKAIADTGARFHGIGDSEMFNQLKITYRPPHLFNGFVSINNYASYLANFDIGIVPLKDSEFNKSKSWLKALEYASVGVVSVVSPTPDNMRLVDLGAALAAKTPDDWYNNVKLLIEDNSMRQEMSEKARKIASELTIEGNIEKWLNVWLEQTNMVYSR